MKPTFSFAMNLKEHCYEEGLNGFVERINNARTNKAGGTLTSNMKYTLYFWRRKYVITFTLSYKNQLCSKIYKVVLRILHM